MNNNMPKLAIRQDDEAHLVRAYFSTMDDSNRFEIATLNLGVVQQCPGAFEAWKAALLDIFKLMLEAEDIKVEGFYEIKSHEGN